MRKALINDLVHSFCYACRCNAQSWPVVILGQPTMAASKVELDSSLLAPFAVYALSLKACNYVIATRHLILLASNLRGMDAQEQFYATQLMNRYYHGCNKQTILDQSIVPRDCEQKLPDTPELQECY